MLKRPDCFFLRYAHHHTVRGEQKFRLACFVSAGLFCRNVAERETHVLSTGAQQNHLGGPGALSELIPGGLWCLWICVVRKLWRANTLRYAIGGGITPKNMFQSFVMFCYYTYYGSTVCSARCTWWCMLRCHSRLFGGWGLLLFSCMFFSYCRSYPVVFQS